MMRRIPPQSNEDSVIEPGEIVSDFVEVTKLAGITIPAADLEIEYLPAPHMPPSRLPNGKLAVYVFMFGRQCLKVGKAGSKSNARYCSQHYGLHAPSTMLSHSSICNPKFA